MTILHLQGYLESRPSRRVMIKPVQSKMARAALGWSLAGAAKRAGVAKATVSGFETGKTKPTRATLAAIKRAYEDAGIEFTNSKQPGVRLKGPG